MKCSHLFSKGPIYYYLLKEGVQIAKKDHTENDESALKNKKNKDPSHSSGERFKSFDSEKGEVLKNMLKNNLCYKQPSLKTVISIGVLK